MSLDFAVKALVAFHKFCFLFFGVVGGADSINIHVVPSLRGSAFLVFDSKCFVESTAEVIMEGVLFLLFAMLFNCFLGPMVKGPRGSKGIIGISIYDVVKESFL
jgi:hypothetical protein